MISIKQAADLTGLPAKTIRYYEDIGLVTPMRAANGYRIFRESDAHKLNFLCKARSLGFSIEDCRRLLALYADSQRASADVKTLARDHVAQIDIKIAELQAMRKTLMHLITCCAGDDRPDCPILSELSGDTPASGPRPTLTEANTSAVAPSRRHGTEADGYAASCPTHEFAPGGAIIR